MSTPSMAGSKTRHFKYSTNEAGVTVTTVDGNEVRTFPIGDLPAEIVSRLAIHGLKQKLSDDVAAVPDTAGKMVGQAETFAKLRAGNWAERSSHDGLSKAHSEFAEIVARITGKPLEEIVASLLAMEPDAENAQGKLLAGERTLHVRKYSKVPAIAAALAERELERAKEKAKALKAEAKAGGGDLSYPV